MSPNVFLLAADNDPSLIPLLRKNPSLASAQDEHGYSLIHAAASYNHIDLLRFLVNDLHVDVNLQDEDQETALFVVETQIAAAVLVEELGIDFHHKGADGLTAREKIAIEGDFPFVVDYLSGIELNETDKKTQPLAAGTTTEVDRTLPPGVKVTLETIDEPGGASSEIDSVLRRRIEELAQRDDFDSPSAQADLRQLIENAISVHEQGDERHRRLKRM
ncbi:hypothetical protein E4U43_007488 [Claviceps pusilla]|uniref:Uncharacterized protein n=1 Tax=Claviceps pusilla TaxID=123648 RepID=A0A9P7NEN4_9HYPO|nr:hypothetical protein E4U43_007488 [Claviceps pusilla]